MKNKRFVIAVAVTLAAVATIHFMDGRPSSPEATPKQHGIVNPDVKTAGMSHESVPQISQRRFEPKPSLAVGSHVDPNTKSKR